MTHTWRASAAILWAAVSIAVGPRPLALAPEWSGDEALARRVRSLAGERAGTRAIAVALVSDEGVRFAGLGTASPSGSGPVDEDSGFEIGSIAKAMNGMLLGDLISEGRVREDSRLSDIVGELGGAPVGGVTLGELSQHYSGLPRTIVGGPSGLLRSTAAQIAGQNPYPPLSPDELFDAASHLGTEGSGSFAYSNIGAALLGHALARASGQPYQEILRDRLLAPMGMTSTVVLTSLDRVPARAVNGSSFVGQPQEPWTGQGYAPAGAISSTARDMVRLLSGVIAGTAPGSDAARPRRAAAREGDRIGYGWFTGRPDGREITWHNGATGGFTSWIGFDTASRHGVVVLSASNRDVGGIARQLIAPTASPPAGRQSLALLGWWTIVMLIGVPLQVAYTAWRPAADWVGALNTVIGAVGAMVLTWLLGSWLSVPWWLWSAATLATGIGAGLVLSRAGTGGRQGRPSAWRLAGLLLNLSVTTWLTMLWLRAWGLE